MPKPLDLALFVREFEREVQGAFPPVWAQRIVLTPLAWVAERRNRDAVHGRAADGAAAAA